MLTVVIVVAPGSVRKSWAMAVLGLLLGCISYPDADSGFLRGLWDLYLYDEIPLVQALVVYGFLLPCVAAYAVKAAACCSARATGRCTCKGQSARSCCC